MSQSRGGGVFMDGQRVWNPLVYPVWWLRPRSSPFLRRLSAVTVFGSDYSKGFSMEKGCSVPGAGRGCAGL